MSSLPDSLVVHPFLPNQTSAFGVQVSHLSDLWREFQKFQDIFRYLRLMSLISSHYCVVTPTSLKYLPFWAHFGILDRAVSGWFSWLFIGCSKHLWGAAFFQYGSIDAKPSPASTYTMQATPYTQPNCAMCKPYSTSEVSQQNLESKLYYGRL